MDYEMTFSNNSIGRNISIDSMNKFKNPKITFKSLDILECKNKIADLIINNEIIDLCKLAVDNGYRVLVLEDKNILPLPFIFKYKGKEIKPIYNYFSKHIISSIIKSVLLDGDGDIKVRIDRSVYLLYYYHFFNKSNIKEIVHNVCIDIEVIISTLINKGLTTYKSYTTSGMIVDLLREKLMSEKLGQYV